MIKYITFALFVAAVSAAPHRSVDFVCPEEDIAATSCLGPKDCEYPNPENCNQFIHCEVNADKKTGNPVVKDCPTGLEWNDNKKECDWPWSSTCGKATGEPSTAEPSTAEPSTAEPSTAQPSTGAPSSSAAPTTEAPASSSTSGGSVNTPPCSEEEIAATACKGPKDCLYPNPDNCNTFLQCTVNADNKTGTPVVMPCASDLEWNDNKKECDYPASSTCPNKGSTAGAPTTSEASTAPPATDAPSSSAEPSTAEPSTASPSTGAPSTEQPASSTSGGSVNTPPCSEEEIAATACKGPKDCLYPNPDNCNTFLQCTVNADNKTGTPVVMPCASDLEWNDNKKECDYPASSTCPNKGSTAGSSSTVEPSTAEPSTAEPSTAQPSTGAPSSTAEPSTAEPSTASPSTGAPSTEQPASSTSGGSVNTPPCSEEEIAATACKGPKDCLYPNPDNCNTFLQCTVNADNRTGTPVVMPCPSGLEWNDNEKKCDWPSSSTCNKGSTAGSSSTAEPSTAEPSTAEPSTAQQSTGAPSSTASPSAPEETTPEPTSASPSAPADTTTTEGPASDTTVTDAPTTGAESETTTQQSDSSTLPACRPEDDDNDSDLDLNKLCDGCSDPRTVAHPSNNGKYIICSGNNNSVRKCAPGLLYSRDQLSCTYAGLVDSNGPSSRS